MWLPIILSWVCQYYIVKGSMHDIEYCHIFADGSGYSPSNNSKLLLVEGNPLDQGIISKFGIAQISLRGRHGTVTHANGVPSLRGKDRVLLVDGRTIGCGAFDCQQHVAITREGSDNTSQFLYWCLVSTEQFSPMMPTSRRVDPNGKTQQNIFKEK